MTVKEIRESLRMTQVEFSKEFNIPVRTIQSWESGDRQPAPYIIGLLERVAKNM